MRNESVKKSLLWRFRGPNEYYTLASYCLVTRGRLETNQDEVNETLLKSFAREGILHFA